MASLPLPARIDHLIQAAGLTQDGLASQIGATRETVNRWVNGSEPKRNFRQKLAELATQVYREEIPPELYRKEIAGPTPLEQAVQQMAETTRLLEEIARTLAAALQGLPTFEGPMPPAEDADSTPPG